VSRGATMTLAALVLLATSAQAAPAAQSGRVVYVTAKRAYVDRGTASGLAVGQTLELQRGRNAAGKCVIEEVSDTRAVCATDDAHVGDSFALPGTAGTAAAPAAVAAPAVVVLAPLVAEGDVQKAQKALAQAPYAKVDENVKRGELGRDTGLIVGRTGADVWSVVTGTTHTYEREHVVLSLRDVSLGFAGLTLDAELEARHWSKGPISGSDIFVWEAAIASRAPGQALSLSVGRVWPWHVPGIGSFDGAQVGFRSEDRSIEAGLFGGGVPDSQNLAPQFKNWIGGLYFSHAGGGAADDLLRGDREEVRVSARRYDDGTGASIFVGEAELQGQLWLTRAIDLGADALVASATGEGVAVGRLTVDLRLRPTESLQLVTRARYLGKSLLDATDLGPRYAAGERLAAADADLSWSATDWLQVSLVGGATRVLDPGQNRTYVGPEVSLPHLFGGVGGVAVGYQEELGVYAGRTIYLQTPLNAGPFRLLARVAYLEDRPNGSVLRQEVEGYAYAEASLTSWMWVRASVMSRVDLYETSGTPSTGIVGNLELQGRY
jgi:hypothetical protein